MDETKERKIREKIAEYIIRIQKYENLNQEDMAINPFLASALKLSSKEEVLKFFLLQRLQRGMVTSFGSLLQEIAKALDSDAKIEDVDLVIKKGDKSHYIQLKSGPEGFTRPALRKTKAAFDKLKREYPECITAIAFCYGVKNQLSKIWGKELYKSADIVLVGKEFWDYFFGDWCYDKLINIFETITIEGNKKDFQRRSFNQIFKIAYSRILRSGQK